MTSAEVPSPSAALSWFAAGSDPEPVTSPKGARMSTFALIHAGNRKGRHWDRLRRVLEESGHRTIASDVPMDQVGAGASDWADVG
jgi:hypothetical protein